MPDKTEQVEVILDLENPDFYINREISMLGFQWRVFDEALDGRNPLLERVKFLAIVASNLAEFFMVRVGGIRLQRDSGVTDLSPDGKTPARMLADIRRDAMQLQQACCSFWSEVLMPELHRMGIRISNYSQLTHNQKQSMDAYFDEIIFPVLTPLAFDPGHPFPHISNLSLNLAVLIRDKQGQEHFARVKVPPTLPQMVPVKRSSGGTKRDGTAPHDHYFVWLDQVITANLRKLFPGMTIVESHLFHVTRNADMVIQELEAIDLLETIEENIRRRRFGDVVRLMINKNMPEYIRDILADNLKIGQNDIYQLNGPLDLMSLMQLTRINRPDLKDKPFTPTIPSILRNLGDSGDDTIFSAIRQGNILLHQPYESFVPVVDFLRTAARDPNVLAIKQTLYRVGSNSPVVKALLEASRDYGKQVAVLVELKARFDEESNINWARMLEQEGVHVIYGLPGLKTHSKIAQVVRREGEHIVRYMHLGTGNYNLTTSTVYEDLGMFTCDDQIGADTTELFNYLTGYSSDNSFRKLLVAPINLRSSFEVMIQREMDLQAGGGEGRLVFKMNHLVDVSMIRWLYRASQAGVQIDIIVRGMCGLKPGIPGLSENIRVRSVVGRFLEHSRIYYFQNGGHEQVYLGSADLMPRNLNERVEVLFPIEDAKMRQYIREVILETYLKDNYSARLMQPDGSFKRIQPKDEDHIRNSQHLFLDMSRP